MRTNAKDLTEEALRGMFAAAIVQCRGKANLSQEALAELTDLSTGYISMLERGKRNLTVLVAAGIAEACGLTLSELVLLAESFGSAKR